jgi:hypothetical protein
MIHLTSKLLKKSDTNSRTHEQVSKMCAFLEKKGFFQYGRRTSMYEPYYYESSGEVKAAGISEITVEVRTSDMYDPDHPEESEWYPKWSAYDHKGKCLKVEREGLSSLVVFLTSYLEGK